MLSTAGWAQHLGCFADQSGARRLPMLANGAAMTRFYATGGLAGGNESVDSCFSAALAGGYSVFGLQMGGDCYLGYNATYAMALGPAPGPLASVGCWSVCPGNVSQVCGGYLALSLYAVHGGWLSVGCFRCSGHV